MAKKKVLAMNKEGKLTYCTSDEKNINKGRCNHISHALPFETNKQFIERKTEKIKNRSELDVASNVYLSKRILVDNVYRSAKLEGISATFADTESILNNKPTDMPPSDISTIIDLKRGWEFVLDDNNLNRDIDISFIEDLHFVLNKGNNNLRYYDIGNIRKDTVAITGTNYRPEIPNREKMHEELIELSKVQDPAKRAFQTFLYIASTQPFMDGNKRVGSYAANSILIRNGSGIFTVPEKLDKHFKKALVKYYETKEEEDIMSIMNKYCYIYKLDGLPDFVLDRE